MNKVSVGSLSNDNCPQTMYLFGTYKEDGTPNYGLFCWVSYCWDGELQMMVCIGGEKLTKDRIRETGMFSVNLVNEALLPVADYYGNTLGYDAVKMNVSMETIKGEVLNVPIIKESPWSYELEVKKTIQMDDGDVFICKIHNIMADEALLDKSKSVEELSKITSAVITTPETYYSVGKELGAWGAMKDKR